MTRIIRAVLGVLLLSGVAALLLWQRWTIEGLRGENAGLREQATQLETLREENARLAAALTNSAELRRLRAGQSELPRLRNEVSQLRRQILEASAKRAQPANQSLPSTEAEQPAAPVETFVATVRAVVPWQQTLVTGGWKLPSGKRVLVFVRPQMSGDGGQPGQILLQIRILELPEEVLGQVGLEGVASDNKQSTSRTILTVEQAAAVMKTLEETAGVNVFSAPRITTLDGRQAQIKSVDVKTLPSGEKYEVGPSVDIVPRITADGSSVDLAIAAQVRLPSGSPR
jgi:hypothetical protein